MEDPILDKIVNRHAFEIRFDCQYDDLNSQFPERSDKQTVYLEASKRILADTGWDFKYLKGDKFFRHTRVEGDREIWFHVVLWDGMMQLMTYAKRRRQEPVGGDVWSILANHCRVKRKPDGWLDGNPMPRYADETELSDLIKCACEIQTRLSDAILSDPGWND